MTNDRKLSQYCVLAASIAVIVVLFCAPSFAETTRPAGVPADFVITPFGYFHPSCVHALAEGQTLLPDGSVRLADGSLQAKKACNYAHYTATGAIVSPEAKAASHLDPTINGWLEYISTTTSDSYGKIMSTWTVPPAPTSNDGQTLFFFPGLEDLNDVISIVQPVLQYGPSGAGGGNFWAVASWNCCINGDTWFSTLLDVNVGDGLQGTIVSTCAPGKNYCATWNVVSEDKTSGKKTTLAKTPADGQTWNWAFGAVSEDYGVVQCSDFPANSGITFTTEAYNQNRTRITNPGWQGTQAAPGTSPKCNYGLKVGTSKETVEY
jgi:hypothetical protein